MKNDPKLNVEILKSFSKLILNVKDEEINFYIFSNKVVNEIIKFPFEYENEDIIFYYINLLKSLATKLETYPLALFYNK